MNDEIKITENPYDILGVARDATSEQIKAAFRRQAQRYHPDRGDDGDSEFFIKVTDAFRILSNPKTRKQYDRAGKVKRKETNRINSAIKNCQSMFLSALNDWRVDSGEFDVFDALVDNVKQNMKQAEKNIKGFKEDIKRMKALKKRIKPKNKKGTEILFEGVLTDRIYGRQDDIERQQEELEIGKIMIDLFKDVTMEGVKKLSNDIEEFDEDGDMVEEEEDYGESDLLSNPILAKALNRFK